MAEKVTIARPYAEAAFQLAKGANALSAWFDVLQRIAVISGDDAMQECIGNPHLQQDELVKLIVGLAGEGLTADQLNFIQVLAKNERLDVLPEIAEIFEEMKNGAEGVSSVEVESAFPMDAAGLQAIVADLESKFGGKYQATVRVVPELIGGVRIAIGDDVIDASVRGKLAVMSTALKS